MLPVADLVMRETERPVAVRQVVRVAPSVFLEGASREVVLDAVALDDQAMVGPEGVDFIAVQ